MKKYYNHIPAIGAGVICLIVYIITLNPTVTFMDSGELAAACATFGIPHPTGYPLFLIIGYIFTKLPISYSPVYNLNLMSAVLSAAAVAVFYYVSYLLLSILKSSSEVQKVKQKKEKHAKEKYSKEKHVKEVNIFNADTITIVSFFASLVFGFSKTFWENALSAEVYPLHSLLLVLLIYFSLKIYFNLKEHNKKNWMILFLLLGTSFANHMTTIFIVPGIVFLYILQYKENPLFAKSLSKQFLFVIPGLLLYLVLMVRASSGPYLNWSEPDTLSNLLHHITGGDYSQLMFSTSSVFSNNFKLFFGTVLNEYAVISGIIAVFGLIFLYKQSRIIFYYFVILILGCLIYSLNYNIRDLLSYFLLIYILLGLTFGIGFINSLNKLVKSKANFTLIAVVTGVVLSGFSLVYNFKDNDESKNYVVEDVTLNTLNELGPNSILMTYDWGYVYPAALYYQQVSNLRGDVKVFNVKFLSVPWYLDMIKKYYPDIYEPCKTEIKSYTGTYGDDNMHTQKLTNLVRTFVDKSYNKYVIYMTFDFAYSKEIKPIISDYMIQPDGLVYRLAAKNSAYDSTAGVQSLQAVFRKYSPDTPEKEKMYISTAGVYFDNAVYHYQHKNNALALRFLDKAIELRSNFNEAIIMRNQLLKETK